MKKVFSALTLFVAVAILTTAIPRAQASDSQNLAEIRLIEDRIRNMDPKEAADDLKRADLLSEAADAVAKLTSNPDKPLDSLQVKEIVELLKLTEKYDMYHVVADRNYEIFKTNEKAIKEEIKKLSPKQAHSMSDMIDVVLSDSSDAQAPVKAKSKSKK